MSYTEINHKKGMPYGGMPYDALLHKLEETDPRLVSEVRGDDPFFDIEDHHNEYVRAEIIDRTPDDTFLESDHARRDPGLSRSIINLRYAGGRGPNDYRLPQHPELFLGFTGNDPRGVVNQPRLDKIRAHTTARAREREVRMGHNVGHGGLIETERPWGGTVMEYDKVEARRRLKKRYRWFTTQKVGRPWGRNVVTDDYYGLRQRANVLKDGGESLYVPEQHQPHSSGGWVQTTSYDPIRGAETDGVRRVDRNANSDTAPWRHTTGDSDLAVQKYTSSTRRGRDKFSPKGSGGTLSTRVSTDQDFGLHQKARSTNRRFLAQSMGTAASHRRALARVAGGDMDHGRSAIIRRMGRSAPELARNIERAARLSHHDQTFRPNGQVQDHEGGRLGPSAGLGAPPEDRQSILYKTAQNHLSPANVRFANAGAMVRSLRQGTTAQFRQVQGQTVATGKMGTATSEHTTSRPGNSGLVPSKDYIALRNKTQTALTRAAAARGLEVHTYGRRTHANLDKPMETIKLAQSGGFTSARNMMRGRREGRTKAPEFHSHTQDPVRLGAHPDLTFGSIGEYSGPHTGGLSIGNKSIRSTTLPDKGDDTLGKFADFDGLGSNMSEAGYRSPIGLRA
jgi:hypothetical protein